MPFAKALDAKTYDSLLNGLKTGYLSHDTICMPADKWVSKVVAAVSAWLALVS